MRGPSTRRTRPRPPTAHPTHHQLRAGFNNLRSEQGLEVEGLSFLPRPALGLHGQETAAALLEAHPDHSVRPWDLKRAPIGWWGQISGNLRRGDPMAIEVAREFVAEFGRAAGLGPLASDPALAAVQFDEYNTTGMKQPYLNRFAALGGLRSVWGGVFGPSAVPRRSSESSGDSEALLEAVEKAEEGPKGRRDFLDRWAKATSSNPMDSLYSINWAGLISSGGEPILRVHNNSPVESVLREYPEYAWEAWKFAWGARGLWAGVGAALRAPQGPDPVALTFTRRYIGYLEEKHNITSLSDWEARGVKSLGSTARAHLLALGGLPTLLRLLHPSTHKEPIKFRTRKQKKPEEPAEVPGERAETFPGPHWAAPVVRRAFVLHTLANAINGGKGDLQDRLYRTKSATIRRLGGRSLLDMYNDSVSGLVMGEAPELAWAGFRFGALGRSFFRIAANRAVHGDELSKAVLREYLEYIMARSGRSGPIEAWNGAELSVTARVRLRPLGSGLNQILAKLYPTHEWKPREKARSGADEADSGWRRARQTLARLALARAFPDHPILEGQRLAGGKGTAKRPSRLSFDFLIPSLRLAVEVQGEQHYGPVFSKELAEDQQRNDRAKEELCRAQGFRLLLVPYWWDSEKLSTALQDLRADRTGFALG